MYDVAVIGAGVVGAMIARTLAAYRLSICILEKSTTWPRAQPRPIPRSFMRDLTRRRAR